MPIYYQSANPIPICGQSVNPLPIRQSLTNLPISDQSIYPMPTLDQADMTVFQPKPLHTHTHTSATTIKTTLSPVKSPILVNPMSMHLAIPYLHREQDLYAGPTIGLDGGRFHCNPSRQSAQPFSIPNNTYMPVYWKSWTHLPIQCQFTDLVSILHQLTNTNPLLIHH